MNDFSRPFSSAPAMDMSVDAGLRGYMLGIYNTMMIGLVVTGLVAFAAAGLFFTTDLSQAATVEGGIAMINSSYALTDLGLMIFGSPLQWVIMLAPLGMVMLISFGANKLSRGATLIAFYAFAVLMGVSLSSIFAVYTGGSIAQTFFVTAAAFAGLSLFGYTTKRDLKGFGSFLIMGLFGIIIASIVNIFLQSSAMEFAISVLGVLIFAGLTAYDTQRLKLSYYEYGGTPEIAGKMQIHGALSLYLNFINMFLFLLRLFGSRE